MEHELLKAALWKPGIQSKYAQVKRDGHRIVYTKDAFGRVFAHTSNGIDVTEQLRLFKWHYGITRWAPYETIIEGELWVPGKPASFVKSAMVNACQEMEFSVFAIPVMEGAKKHLENLDWVEFWATRMLLNAIPYENVSNIVFEDEWLQRACSIADCEGWVFKDYNYANWWKLKPVKTLDVVVVDTKDGNGKNLGLVGSLVCAVHGPRGLITIANAGGMSDLERAEMSLDDPVGRVCEIAYQYVGSQGRLRHPRFMRWRDDKAAEDCNISQDYDLEAHWGLTQ